MKDKWKESSCGGLLVGGVPFNALNASDDEILAVVRGLPAGLRERSRVHTDWQYNPVSPASEYEFSAYNQHNEFKDTQNTQTLQNAIGNYLEAAKAYEDMEQAQPAANMYSFAAQCYCELPDNPFEGGRPAVQYAVDFFDKAIALHDQQGHADFSYRDRNLRYDAVAQTALYYRGNEDPQGLAMQYYQRLAVEADELAQCARRLQGDLDPRALRVEQKEVGISDTLPIGTDNVSPCVALMVHSSNTSEKGNGKPVVALAHVDCMADVSSLGKVFDLMPDGEKSVRLLGARFEQTPHSVENLCNIVRALGQYNVNVISADVLQGNEGASSVVVMPQDFSIREAVPTFGDRLANASSACPLIRQDVPHPLRIAFDARQDNFERTAMLLDSFMVGELHKLYHGKDDVELYQALRRGNFHDIGLSTCYIKDLLNEYEFSLNEIRPYAKSKLPAPLLEGITAFPIYIGENADVYNRQMIDAALELYNNGAFNLDALEQAAKNFTPSCKFSSQDLSF